MFTRLPPWTTLDRAMEVRMLVMLVMIVTLAILVRGDGVMGRRKTGVCVSSCQTLSAFALRTSTPGLLS